MSKPQVKENNFEPGVGGTAGALNYQTGYGTHASPDVSQDPAHFEQGSKHIGNKGNTAKSAPKGSTIGRDVNAIYSKRDVPTPDEVITGIKYELGQQIKKDKLIAKQTVLDNLKKDPHFYGKLKMLNIDDESMMQNMSEGKSHPNDSAAKPKITPNIEATKQIFAEMAKGHEKKYVVNSQICDVMKEMWQAKKARNAWRG